MPSLPCLGRRPGTATRRGSHHTVWRAGGCRLVGARRVRRHPDETAAVSSPPQSAVAARVPGAAALGLVALPAAVAVPAVALTDPRWTAAVLDERAVREGTDD